MSLSTNEKKRLFIDMDGVLCDFVKAREKHLVGNPGNKWPQMEYNFFLNLEPIPGAIQAYNKLKEKYDVFILSAPSRCNPLSYTEKRLWVEKHLGFEETDKLILTTHKELLSGAYLIDDRPNKNGAEFFDGHVIHFGSEFYPDWNSVLNSIY